MQFIFKLFFDLFGEGKVGPSILMSTNYAQILDQDEADILDACAKWQK